MIIGYRLWIFFYKLKQRENIQFSIKNYLLLVRCINGICFKFLACARSWVWTSDSVWIHSTFTKLKFKSLILGA